MKSPDQVPVPGPVQKMLGKALAANNGTDDEPAVTPQRRTLSEASAARRRRETSCREWMQSRGYNRGC